MKFIHTADLHFGGCKSLPNYLSRHEHMFDSIFELAYDRNIDTVVIAGDIFDEDDPDYDTVTLVQKKFLDYDAAGFRILAIPGNHDHRDAQGRTALRYLAQLSEGGRFRNSTVVERTSYVQVGDTVFCLLVHTPGKFREDSKAAVRDFFKSSIRPAFSHFVVVAHETIFGSLTDGSHRLDTGYKAPSARLPVTFWALGDIHKHQRVSKNAFYSGSPIQKRFGDDFPKGVLVVDTDDPSNPEFVPIDTIRLVKAMPGEEVPENSYVKLSINPQEVGTVRVASNVVKFSLQKEEQKLELDLSSSLREKLLQGVEQLAKNNSDTFSDVCSLAASEIDSLLASTSSDLDS